jgi:S-adenosylmethionine:tRNA ribosyltransferase-isomerase
MLTEIEFTLPDALLAKEPPERRGLSRDGVRLMVVDRRTGAVSHTRFDRIAEALAPGDLLVFNTSRTLPASLEGRAVESGAAVELRLAERLPDDTWLALLLCEGPEPFACGLAEGLTLDFGGGLSAAVLGRDARVARLWRVRFSAAGAEFVDRLYRLGQPIRYEYVSAPWRLDAYQTVFAGEPGSAEMPSAGRAFTWRLLLGLKRRGVETASVVLHTGLSSYMDDALDRSRIAPEEEFRVGEEAAAKVDAARRRGSRVVAVGTTVARALESAAGPDGRVRPTGGYTRLRIDAAHRLRAVDGLLTGMHEPEASHLDLLSAFVPPDVLGAAYREAVALGYLWHEFGDLNLIV